MVGTTLGVYRIDAEIGRGGMGQVYRARDTALNRDVAIKVLPDGLADDPDRLMRFEREAQALAALNHPNIAHVYGLEKSGGTPAIVMELVEGPTLADRIAKGPIPLDEALLIARQIAEGLEAAHERGIIHRDLKPANIKVTDDGTVKLLDFGLAKALAPDPASPEADELANSPTLTARATQMGVILGTAAYMAPEQAKGKAVDRRVDVWAFGVVLYEMLTGQRPFEGSDVSEVMARVIDREPDWSALPASTPPAIERLLRRCLVKQRKDRLHDIGDARLEVAEPPEAQSARLLSPPGRWPMQRVAPLAGVVVAMLLALAYWMGTLANVSEDVSPGVAAKTVATEIRLPAGVTLPLGAQASDVGFDSPSIALSPDGTVLALVGLFQGTTRLYVRRVESFTVEEVAGTEGAIHPFFSPDGLSLGFLTNTQVKKVSLQGGQPHTLCDVQIPVIATWALDDAIYFTSNQTTRLWRTDADGRDCREVGPAVVGRRYGKVLPSGQWAFVTDTGAHSSADHSSIQLLSLATSELRPLLSNGYDAHYVRTGHILFGRAGGLYAASFGEASLSVGEPILVADDVRMDSFFSVVQVAASDTGLIAYVPGGDASVGRMAWVSRDGTTEFLPPEERLYGTLDLASDGQRVAVQIADVRDYIGIYDIGRNEWAYLRGPDNYSLPMWSADGRQLAYIKQPEDGHRELIVQNASDPDSAHVVLSHEQSFGIQSWHPDGRTLAIGRGGVGLFLSLSGDAAQPREVDPAFAGAMYAFSPDGSHIAYGSSESGQSQVYVRSYPDNRLTRFNSGGFGIEPRWCDECGAIFFRRGSQFLMAATQTTPVFSYEPPRVVFKANEFVDTPGRSFDVTADGQRLLVVTRAREMPLTTVHLLQHSLPGPGNGVSRR